MPSGQSDSAAVDAAFLVASVYCAARLGGGRQKSSLAIMAPSWLNKLGNMLPPPRQTKLSRYSIRVFLQAVAAEFVGTFAFALLGLGSITSACHIPDVPAFSDSNSTAIMNEGSADSAAAPPVCSLESVNVLSTALAFSFGLFVAVYTTAAISGGCINPAVTFACFLAGKLSLVRSVAYMGAECLGSLAAALVLREVDPEAFKAAKGGANAVNAGRGVSKVSAWGTESILTFALVFTVFTATDPQRRAEAAHLTVLAPLAIGLVVFCSHLFAIPLDGCSLNPARSLGPAVVADAWKDHWIFWAGPFCGAVVAFLAFELLFKHIKAPPTEECVELGTAVMGIAEVDRKSEVASVLTLTTHDLCPTAFHDPQLIERALEGDPPGEIRSWTPPPARMDSIAQDQAGRLGPGKSPPRWLNYRL